MRGKQRDDEKTISPSMHKKELNNVDIDELTVVPTMTGDESSPNSIDSSSEEGCSVIDNKKKIGFSSADSRFSNSAAAASFIKRNFWIVASIVVLIFIIFFSFMIPIAVLSKGGLRKENNNDKLTDPNRSGLFSDLGQQQQQQQQNTGTGLFGETGSLAGDSAADSSLADSTHVHDSSLADFSHVDDSRVADSTHVDDSNLADSNHIDSSDSDEGIHNNSSTVATVGFDNAVEQATGRVNVLQPSISPMGRNPPMRAPTRPAKKIVYNAGTPWDIASQASSLQPEKIAPTPQTATASISQPTFGLVPAASDATQTSFGIVPSSKQAEDEETLHFQIESTTESAPNNDNEGRLETDHIYSVPALGTISPETPELVHTMVDAVPTTQNQAPPFYPVDKPPAIGETVFFAMADVPYSMIERELLVEYVQMVPETTTNSTEHPTQSKFLIHLGDIKRGTSDSCTREVYEDFALRMRHSNVPVFIIIGDNEWNDCENPDEAFELWKEIFVNFQNNWQHDLKVVNQQGRPENFMFIDNSILYVGLNIVGIPVLNQTEWDTRLTEQAEWVISLINLFYIYKPQDQRIHSLVIFGHSDPGPSFRPFFRPLNSFISGQSLNNQLPVLYLHGNLHKFNHRADYYENTNILLLTLNAGVEDAPLKMMIDPTSSKSVKANDVFQYNREWDNEQERNRRHRILRGEETF